MVNDVDKDRAEQCEVDYYDNPVFGDRILRPRRRRSRNKDD